MRKKINARNIWNLFLLHVGVFLIAVNIHFFLEPNHFAAGGLGGLSIVLKALFPMYSLGVLMLSLNIILFIIGFAFLGFQFGIKTIYASFLLTFMVWILGEYYSLGTAISHDLFLQLVIGTLIAGLGLVIVFQQNASTGGMDLIAMILNKYFSFDIGKAVLIADCTISVLAIFAFGMERGLYACFGIFFRGIVIEYFNSQLTTTKEVVIISEKCDLIQEFIIHQLQSSATIHTAKGAYSEDEKKVITIVLERQDFIKLKRFIFQMDKKAFVTVHNMNEVMGIGFNKTVKN
ncbi:YitT family protein [Niallia sp. 03133]|uniref:YitT family protein n=1 Tax=Niallia sp. 03133 TaxID=3458060 RepID=UPI0040443C9C